MALVDRLRERAQEIQGDPTQTLEQKEAQLLPLLQQEKAQLAENIRYWQQYNEANKGSTDPAVMSRIEQNDRRISQSQRQGNQLNQRVGVNDFGGQLNQSMVHEVDELGTAAQNTAKVFDTTLNAAIDGTAQALSAVIMQTGDWKQATANAIRSMISNLIELGVKTVAHYALAKVQMALFGAARSADRVKDNAEAAASGASKTASLTTASLLESITSYGAAAVIGVAAMLAAMAIVGAFEEGGHTGGTKGVIAGVVHGQEYVINADAAQAVPREFLDALNTQQVSVAGGVAAVSSGGAMTPAASSAMLGALNSQQVAAATGNDGAVSSGRVSAFSGSAAQERNAAGNVSVGSPNVKVVNVTDDAAARRELLNSGEFDQAFVHHMKRHGVPGKRT